MPRPVPGGRPQSLDNILRLLEELTCFFKLSRVTMHVCQLIRGVGIGRIQLQLTFEFLRRLVASSVE